MDDSASGKIHAIQSKDELGILVGHRHKGGELPFARRLALHDVCDLHIHPGIAPFADEIDLLLLHPSDTDVIPAPDKLAIDD